MTLPTRIVLLGGARSGKSTAAERRLADCTAVTYLATGPAPGTSDPDWAARVKAHQDRRPDHWTTVHSTDVASVLATCTEPILWDDVGTWVTSVLDNHQAWSTPRENWLEPVTKDFAAVIAAWQARTTPVVAVAPETGLGVIPASSGGRLFRDLLGDVNQQLVASSDYAALCVAGALLPLSPCPW